MGNGVYIFIDESGVHKQEGLSAVALVYIYSKHLNDVQNAVRNSERKLGLDYFHWSHSSWPVREKFILGLSKSHFSLKIALIKNPFHEKEVFNKALMYLITEKNISSVIIDGKKSGAYARNIKKVLDTKGISVEKIKTASTTGYPALRIADAVAGLVRCKYEKPNSKVVQKLYMIIAAKILIPFEDQTVN